MLKGIHSISSVCFNSCLMSSVYYELVACEVWLWALEWTLAFSESLKVKSWQHLAVVFPPPSGICSTLVSVISSTGMSFLLVKYFIANRGWSWTRKKSGRIFTSALNSAGDLGRAVLSQPQPLVCKRVCNTGLLDYTDRRLAEKIHM